MQFVATVPLHVADAEAHDANAHVLLVQVLVFPPMSPQLR